MRNKLFFIKLAMATLFLSSCAPKDPGFKPVATIKDIMDSVVDPNADNLWESVATTIDANGITEKYPRTDEEWKKVRANALALVEAPNLLIMTPRIVAEAGHKSENPGIELEPQEIQKLIDDDRETFRKLALELQVSALEALKAIDAKDKEKLSDAGGPIDHACESCHLKYWYPSEAEALKAREEGKASPLSNAAPAKEPAKEPVKGKELTEKK